MIIFHNVIHAFGYCSNLDLLIEIIQPGIIHNVINAELYLFLFFLIVRKHESLDKFGVELVGDDLCTTDLQPFGVVPVSVSALLLQYGLFGLLFAVLLLKRLVLVIVSALLQKVTHPRRFLQTCRYSCRLQSWSRLTRKFSSGADFRI